MIRPSLLYRLATKPSLKAHAVQGLTILELLVVIVLVGILSAIALPSFLKLTNRAKQAEAQNYIGVINRAQQVHYFEQASFSNLAALNLGIPTATRYYQYSSEPAQEGDRPIAHTIAAPTESIRGYAGKVWIKSEHDIGATTVSVLCEGNINEVPTITGNKCPE